MDKRALPYIENYFKKYVNKDYFVGKHQEYTALLNPSYLNLKSEIEKLSSGIEYKDKLIIYLVAMHYLEKVQGYYDKLLQDALIRTNEGEK